MKQTLLKAWGLTAILSAAILWPVRENWRPQPQDDFPFSYYPMFSSQREETYRVTYLLGYDSAGRRYQIPYGYAGTGGFNQVRRKLNAARSNGQAPQLLAQVARAWARRHGQEGPRLLRFDLVRGRFHLDRFFLEADRSPLEEEIIFTYHPPLDECR